MAIANDPFNEGVSDAWKVAMECEYTDVWGFLTSNFLWGETEEGYYYWETIADEYC